ncbi:exonuclease V, chloroplastic-like [Malania oleifera]|uniref:exonuclease V, chloroplastic-like n=1 Tax=Malania oleifera TaxID=397392 RepID=UPI0025ADB784|nr:exonuclease V, chloroplastic-like [Malania oleifera]
MSAKYRDIPLPTGNGSKASIVNRDSQRTTGVPAIATGSGRVLRRLARSPKMAESEPPPHPATTPANDNCQVPEIENEIPIEIVSAEEMALLDAALSAARSSLSSAVAAAAASSSPRSSAFASLSSTRFQRNVRSIQSITLLSKRRITGSTGPCTVGDIEDSGNFGSTQKRIRANESLLRRFRKKGLSVTDITGTEWCEKQMEFVLLFGKPIKTKAMKAGSARHVKLEEEVVKKVKVLTKSVEDVWALRFINFIVGANQLMFEGLTRELPVIGFVDGVWVVGVIDEIRMPAIENERNPTLVDTKTRVQATLPAEAQRRNGRLQLMCYKFLWDNLVADNFPSKQFFDFFTLNPHYILSEEIRKNTALSDFPVQTLNDLVRYFINTCCVLPQAHGELLLRYELQKDHSLLGEDFFSYDSDWLKNQLHSCLEFWSGEREGRYVPREECWKCRFCKFASVCPESTDLNSTRR